MPLNLYQGIYASGAVPKGWTATRQAGLKYPVRNPAVLRELRRLRKGRWQKVIKHGEPGELHYFEHESGNVAGVKFISRNVKP